MSKCWFVYIVKCSDSSLYCGVTTDLDRRIEEHNSTSKGSKYVRSRRPAKLVYFEKAENRSRAQSRESAIKSLRRIQKLDLIRKFESELLQ